MFSWPSATWGWSSAGITGGIFVSHGVYHRRFSKQSEDLCHQRVTIVFLSLSSGDICGINKTGHHGEGVCMCSLAVFAVSLLCGLCQCVFISLLIADGFLFSIREVSDCLKGLPFTCLKSQNRRERKLRWDRARSFDSTTSASFQWSWNSSVNSSDTVRRKA